MLAIWMVEEMSNLDAEDNHELQQKYIWEMLLKLQLTKAKPPVFSHLSFYKTEVTIVALRNLRLKFSNCCWNEC